MLQPTELKLDLPMKIANGVTSTTTKVWKMLVASKAGDLNAIKSLVNETPELAFAQYNYTPPIHFAVREGHVELVNYLLGLGAYAPDYKTYPFLDTLPTLAADRGHNDIVFQLEKYRLETDRQKFAGDNGEIFYQRSELENEFESAVDKEDLETTERILRMHPDFAKDETFFWGEGILLFAAKGNNRAMVDLLIQFGAVVPPLLKWTQFYYFEHKEGADYMMQKGMNPNTMSWQHVTILHDMAQKGNLPKAELLIRYKANIDAIDEEYQSTPLGMAVRWGHLEMTRYLLSEGADSSLAGASWATPLSWATKKGYPEIAEVLLKAGAR